MSNDPGLSDFDQFEEALRKASDIAAPYGEAAIGQYLTKLQAIMSPYAPQPDRDRANPGDKPSPYNTYVRGVGQFPRSSFQQTEQGWKRKKRGAYKQGPRKGRVHYTSQKMSHKWRVEVRRDGANVVGELRNEASYSGIVLGHKPGEPDTDGIPEQAAFHAESGWPNVDDSLQSVEAAKDELLGRAADQTIQKIISG